MDEVLVEDIAATLVRELDPERIYLFGSRARGDAGAEADLDLLIVVAEPFGSGRSRLVEITRARRALSTFRVPKDILVYSTDEIERWRNSSNHIVARCIREGNLLYERDGR